MTYKQLFACTLLVLMGFASQAQKPAPSKKPAGTSSAAMTEATANKVVSYTNTIIDLYNQYLGKFKDYERTIEEGDRKIEQVRKKYDPRFSIQFSAASFPVAVGYYNKYDEALKAVPAFNGKQDIINAVKTATADAESLSKSGLTMRAYFVGKELEKDDVKYSHYDVIKDSMEFYLEQTRKDWKKAVGLASNAGDEAELVLLKKSPLAPFIIPMKTDLKSLKSLLDELENEENEKADYTALKPKVAAMQATLEKDKSTQGKNVSVLSHETYYTTFFEKGIKLTQTMTLLIDELTKDKPNDRTLEKNYNDIGIYYDEVIGCYNNFAEYGAK